MRYSFLKGLFALTWVLVLSFATPRKRKYVTLTEPENMQLNPYNRYHAWIPVQYTTSSFLELTELLATAQRDKLGEGQNWCSPDL